MKLSPNFVVVAARWLHRQHRNGAIRRDTAAAANGWKPTHRGAITDRWTHVKEALRFDGLAMREEAQRVLNTRLDVKPVEDRRECLTCCGDGMVPDSDTEENWTCEDCGGDGRVTVSVTPGLRVASVLWHGSTPHTAEDSWMALLDDGRVGLVARLPKVEQWAPLSCPSPSCREARRCGYRTSIMCTTCKGTGEGMRLVDPKPARIIGLLPDAESALASLPAAYFTAETCAEVMGRWAARPRAVVEAVGLLGGGV